MSGSEEKYLVGAQAAEFLGVKPATLYAYASRGQIESIPGASGRERCYRLSDLIRLRQSARGVKTTRDSEPAVWTGPAIKSAITEIKSDGHFYRGHSAIEMALRGDSFETTAELLWGIGDLEERRESRDNGSDKYENAGEKLWRQASLMNCSSLENLISPDVECLELLKLLLVMLEMKDPVSRKLSGEDVYETARRLILTMASSVGLTDKKTIKTDSPYLIGSILAGDHLEKAKLINLALVLCADHELNASALSARIAASCDASLYSCLLSALGSFSGSLHGSASRRTEDYVNSSFTFSSARSWLKDYLRQNETIAGFGTELYDQGDPRARVLIESALAYDGENEKLKRLREIVECVGEDMSLFPNLDVGLAAITYALGLPSGSGSTIFAVSRAAGWIAHAIEQRLYGGIIRPRARYIGKTAIS